jgi:hypothetical protein
VFITATGNKDIITAKHMARMKDKAIVANIGHFDNEIDMAGLAKTPGIEKTEIKPQYHEWTFPDGHSVLILAEGRLMNLGCATGHPSFVMSASFTNQVIAQIELARNDDQYKKKVYVLPKHLDEKVARLHLDQLGVKLTELQQGAGGLHRRAEGRASVDKPDCFPCRRRTLPLLAVLRTDRQIPHRDVGFHLPALFRDPGHHQVHVLPFHRGLHPLPLGLIIERTQEAPRAGLFRPDMHDRHIGRRQIQALTTHRTLGTRGERDRSVETTSRSFPGSRHRPRKTGNHRRRADFAVDVEVIDRVADHTTCTAAD